MNKELNVQECDANEDEQRLNAGLKKEKIIFVIASLTTLQSPSPYSSSAHHVHIAAAIKGGAALVHGVQMMNKVKAIAM